MPRKKKTGREPSDPQEGEDSAPNAKTRKGERTRARILEVAIDLFQEKGFEKTGMRDIADAAELSLGSAYYYFPSKDHLVQGIYSFAHRIHVEALEPRLATSKKLETRLRALLTTKIESAEPYHGFSAHIFRNAADPKSPLNPFGHASEEVRGDAIALVRTVVEGSDARLPKDLRAELPELLWLYEMAVILFWIHDESPERRRTHRLIEHTVKIVMGLVSLASLPPMRPVRRRISKLLAELREEEDGE